MGDRCNLNNLLLEHEELHCSICKNVLRPPIMLTQNEGNVCGRCYIIRAEKSTAIQNTAIECVIRHLVIFCKYRKYGCPLQLQYPRLLEHEKKCSYRPTGFSPTDEWKGPAEMEHIL